MNEKKVGLGSAPKAHPSPTDGWRAPLAENPFHPPQRSEGGPPLLFWSILKRFGHFFSSPRYIRQLHPMHQCGKLVILFSNSCSK
jgi:hypothetical protein